MEYGVGPVARGQSHHSTLRQGTAAGSTQPGRDDPPGWDGTGRRLPPFHEPELIAPEPVLVPEPAAVAALDVLVPEPAAVAALDAGVQLVTNRQVQRAHQFDIVAKRALDIVLALLLLVMLLPLVALLAIAIQLDSRGPTFFRCERAGYRGRRLMMLKFRKMRDGAAGLPLTLEHDPRFTRIGASLSRLKLDEIPQLWHVLRGEMSLVGPRPESSRFVDCYPHEYERILSTRPGIVGLSQLAFVDESRILDERDPVRHYIEQILPHKVELDLLYVERRSVWFDLRILLWSTVAVLLRRPITVERATGRVRWGRPR